MKSLNILFATACLFVLVFATSCLDSNSNSTNFDDGEYMTISSSSIFVDELIGDSGKRYIPTNPELLQLKNNQTGEIIIPERALVYFSYVGGEVEKTKDTPKIKIEFFDMLPVAQFNLQADTLNIAENEDKFTPFMEVMKPWGANNYINIGFKFAYDVQKLPILNDFSLFIEEASEKTLNLRLVDSREKGMSSNVAGLTISYKIPTETLVHEYPDLDISDSISVIITANKLNEGIKTLPEFKIKLK